MKVLINGASGQLAGALKRSSPVSAALEVVYLSRSEWDIADPAANRRVLELHKPDVLVNTAAYTKVDHAEKELAEASAINHLALRSLSEAANACGTKLIHISTDYVFDGYSREDNSEDDPCFPINNYGLTKRLGELALQSQCQDYIILRTSWLYTFIGNNFFNTILRLAEEKAEISIVSDQVSSPTYADDLAKTIWEIITSKHKDLKGIFHYSNSGEASWFQFAKEIVRLSGKSCKVKDIPSSAYPQAAKRPTYSKLNTEKIAKQLNLNIPSWQNGLERCWEQYKISKLNA